MTLQQVLWAITALGALVAAIGAVVVLRDRGGLREPGMALTGMFIGLLLCLGGFLLSIPRYRDSLAVVGAAAVAGVLVGLLVSRRGARRDRAGRH